MFAKLSPYPAGRIGLRWVSITRNFKASASSIVSEWQNLSKFTTAERQEEIFLNKANLIKVGLGAHLRELGSAQLIACVESLAHWESLREALREGGNLKKIMDEVKLSELRCSDRVLVEIAAMLDAESVRRLWSPFDNERTYINDMRVLVDLSKAWSRANTQGNRGGSFPGQFIYKW